LLFEVSFPRSDRTLAASGRRSYETFMRVHQTALIAVANRSHNQKITFIALKNFVVTRFFIVA